MSEYFDEYGDGGYASQKPNGGKRKKFPITLIIVLFIVVTTSAYLVIVIPNKTTDKKTNIDASELLPTEEKSINDDNNSDKKSYANIYDAMDDSIRKSIEDMKTSGNITYGTPITQSELVLSIGTITVIEYKEHISIISYFDGILFQCPVAEFYSNIVLVGWSKNSNKTSEQTIIFWNDSKIPDLSTLVFNKDGSINDGETVISTEYLSRYSKYLDMGFFDGLNDIESITESDMKEFYVEIEASGMPVKTFLVDSQKILDFVKAQKSE